MKQPAPGAHGFEPPLGDLFGTGRLTFTSSSLKVNPINTKDCVNTKIVSG